MAKSAPRDKSSSNRRKTQTTKQTRRGQRQQQTAEPPSAARGNKALSPLDQAYAIVEKGMRSPDPQRAFDAARRALEISGDCVAAWMLLAEFAGDTRQSLALCLQGAAAAERVLGPEVFEKGVGEFWSRTETRPYMHARLAISERLWDLGRRDETIEHLFELLRLDPQDHLGCRYLLAARLIEQSRDGELQPLLQSYDEASTRWRFAQALAAFRRVGDTAESVRLLADARRTNAHVEQVLLTPGPAPDRTPIAGSAESPEEAAIVAEEFGAAWRSTPGAITWFRETIVAARQARNRRRRPTGPTDAVKQRLRKAPQAYGLAWQAVVHRVASYLMESGQLIRPWSLLIVSESEQLIVSQQLFPVQPTSDAVFDELAQAIHRPGGGGRRRPSEIQVRENALWEALQPHLEEIGIDLIYRDALPEIDDAVRDMAGAFTSVADRPGLVELAAVSPADVRELYAAAAEYYRRAPWRRFPQQAVIRVECPAFEKHAPGPWYACVLGQAGLTLGLAIYDSLDDILEEHEPAEDVSAALQQRNASSVLFVEGFEIAQSDLTESVRENWELAGPEAYPLVVRVGPRGKAREPKPWNIEQLTACLRAIPAFVERHAPFDEPVDENFTVKTASRELALSLSAGPDSGGCCGEDCSTCEHDDCDSCDEHCH